MLTKTILKEQIEKFPEEFSAQCKYYGGECISLKSALLL
jgi:hypothetical protein